MFQYIQTEDIEWIETITSRFKHPNTERPVIHILVKPQVSLQPIQTRYVKFRKL